MTANSYTSAYNGPLLLSKAENKTFILFALGCLFHLPLALLMTQTSWVATVHAIATVAVGLWFIMHDRVPLRVVYVVAYIVGAEVLWRMTKAGIYWEFGKYAVVLLLALAIMKWRFKLAPLPIIYFLLLTPSVILTLGAISDFEEARQLISFNLSGPLCLAVAALFFDQYTFSWKRFRELLLVMLIPIVATGFLVLYKAQLLDQIRFSLNSNSALSGGFGPNQVSAILSMGVLLCWVYTLSDRGAHARRLILWVMMGWLLVQTALTFSRGGIYNLLFAVPVATWFLTQSTSETRRNVFLGIAILAIGGYFLLPLINDWTGGMLASRFQDLDTSGRADIMQAELQTWLDNPLSGVGPGVSSIANVAYLGGIEAAHTEFSRLLAEHGLLGLAALLLLFSLPFRAFSRSRGLGSRGMALAFMVWALVDMLHADMRIALVSFAYALPLVRIEADVE